jgi:hypothetical protein
MMVATVSTVGAVSSNGIPRTESAFAVDGILDETAWETAWSTELPYEVTPADNAPAPVRTVVMVLHDEASLFIGMRAYDPAPEGIRAHLTDRDKGWDDDWMGVVLDTFNDTRRNFLLVVNPLGVQMDTIESWPGGQAEWDAIWESAARITDWGWAAELRIPFSSLRFQRSDGPQVWGFDAIRGYPRDRFRQMGAFARDRNNDCYLCQAIKIEGFDGVSPGRNLEIAPTLVASRTERRPDLASGFDDPENDLEPGVTARWGFTPNLTLGLTLNPDFSQVEADAGQLDVNEPFALLVPEKRAFFQEGSDFFATPLQAVYTRTIRDPAWGLKITGKEGAHTVGLSVVEDDVTNLIIPGAYGSTATTLDRSSTAAVARYKYDIGERFTLGFLGTHREGDDYRNSVSGFDADLLLTKKDRLRVQVLRSSTLYSDSMGRFDDLATTLYYTRNARNLSLWALAEELGDGFRADLGFMPQVDSRGGQVGTSYNWIGTDETWHSLLNLKTKLERRDDGDGNLLFEEYVAQFTANGPLQSQMILRLAGGREGFADPDQDVPHQVFDGDTIVLKAALQPNANSRIECTYRGGDRIDYANAQQGRRFHLNPSFWYRAGRHLRLEGSHIYERMTVDAGRLYTANVSELNTAWQFNARSFVRVILQNVDYDFVTANYIDGRDPTFRQFFSQLLYSYKVNPRTVMFAGYSDNSFDPTGDGLVRADRTLFAKIGYAWVM